jgi:uncharacterized membrane protein
MEYLLLGLLALGIPVAWTAAFFMALGARQRLSVVERRLLGLERNLVLGTAGGPASAASAPEAQPSGPPPMPAPAVETPPQATVQPPVQPPAEPASEPPPATERPPEPEVPPSGAPPRAGLEMFAPARRERTPPSPPQPAQTGPGLEERLGTRWVVWVGGVALALGAIFLVRYSIEQGLIGPGMRIFLGALFAAALITAGEWTRRRESMSAATSLPQASIPAMLTAAGTIAAFATVWAAYGLYAFLGPGSAFLLLGVVALATLAAALLHGPALAGLGLVGAYVTPLLVSTEQPSFWALYLYLAVVTAAAFALARARLWRWLAITAVVASTLWILPGLIDAPGEPAPHLLYLLVAFGLASALIVSGLAFGPDAQPDAVDGVSSAALAAYLAATAMVVVANEHQTLTLAAFVLLCAATVAIAWRTSAAVAAVPIAALIAAIVIAEWSVQMRFETLLAPGGPVARDAPGPTYTFVGTHLAVGSLLAALFAAAGFLAQGRAGRGVISLLWASAALIAPIAILVALYYRVAGFDRSIPFAALALLLAALYATATERLQAKSERPGVASAAALFAVGAVAALALALTMALEKGWLTVALALMAPGIAMVADKRPLPLLRWLAAGVAALVCARIVWEPRIVTDVGTTPIFNWILWGYGVPALAFWTGAHLLRRRADDVPARMLDSAAILFTVLTFALQIRHTLTGNIYDPVPQLEEYGLQVSALIAVAIGLERVRGRSRNIVHNVGAVIVAGLALALAIVGPMLAANPLMAGSVRGGAFFNSLLLGYGLPALLAITLALVAKETRPMAYRAVAAASAVVLTLTYFSLQVRLFYQGPYLSIFKHTSAAEWWTYSAVWLAFGVVLLLVGLLIRSQPARLASAVVILLTVLKVFLLDLAGIGGIWRALSFIMLGAVLMAIGWLYQRLLFPPKPPGLADEPETPPPEPRSQESATPA